MANKPPTTFTALRTPLANSDGSMSWTWTQWFLDAQNRIQNGLDQIGNFIGQLNQSTGIVGRGGTIGTITGNLDDSGVVTGPGVDFARSYLHKDTDHIGDGVGSPLQGGKTAFQAMVSSSPASGQSLFFNGSSWGSRDAHFTDITGVATAVQLPPLSGLGGSVAPGQVPALSLLSGAVTPAQVPVLSSLSGTVTAAQVPALSGLSGQITAGQLPAGGFSGTVPLAKITTGGTDGSLTVTSGLITAVTDPT